jgi:guanylate kinase
LSKQKSRKSVSRSRTSNRGILFVLSAPSGTGKTTLVARLLRKDRSLARTVSHTTRPPRPGEKDGRDYHFVGRKTFEGMIGKRAFVEWARVYREFYGTSRKTIEERLRAGKDVILVIESKGGKAIRRLYRDSVRILLLPPDLKTLRRRLRKRGVVPALRIRAAQKEARSMAGYDYLVVNDRIEEAVAGLSAVIGAERQRMSRNQAILNAFVNR